MSLPIPADTPVPTLFSLSDRVAAITGGSRGIGLSAAYALAEAGADVAILYTTSSTAEQTATEIAHRTGRKVQAYRANVVSQQEIATAFDEILTDFGRLDVVVANAGVSGVAPVLEAGKADYEAIVKTNLDGAFWTAQAAGRIFERQERRLNDGENGASISRGFRGNLIFTASMSALIVNVPQRQAVYNASKAAVVQLAKSLAVEWVERGWRVNCISPGTVATDCGSSSSSISNRVLSVVDVFPRFFFLILSHIYPFFSSPLPNI